MRRALIPLAAVIGMLALVGCETNPGGHSAATNTDLVNHARTTLQKMEAQDPNLRTTVDNAYGYAIFPDVGQGAAGIGAAYGKGVVYQGGQMIGTVDLNQVSAGLQLGGQTFGELIIFKDDTALSQLKNNTLQFGAQATAVVVKAGASGAGQFNNGTEIFVLPQGGLMAGVSLDGQKFTYHPSDNGNL